MNERPATPRIATVTHARLRLSQGDVDGARRIAEALLATDPSHEGARSILAEAEGHEASPWAELAEEILEPPRAAGAGELATAFRAALGARPRSARGDAASPTDRLRAWAAAVRRRREAERVR